MQKAIAINVVENGEIVGFDVSYGGANHRLMIGDSYEGSKAIETANDAAEWIVSLVTNECARREARTNGNT